MPALCGRAERFALFAELVEALVAAAAPAGPPLALEDVHWADRSSLLLLRQLCAELAGARILVVASHRPRDRGPFAEIGGDLLRSPGATAVRLGGLGPDEVRGWLAELFPDGDAALADLLHEGGPGDPRGG